MRDRRFSSADFPAAQCPTCKAMVLTYLVIGSQGNLVRSCVRCDTPINTPLDWLDAEGLKELGFDNESKPRRSGGCGGGCGCASRART